MRAQVSYKPAFLRAQRVVCQAQEWFSDLGNVWPERCDAVAVTLMILRKSVQQWLVDLERGGYPRNGQLVNDLCFIQGRVDNLMIDLKVFREHCQVVSRPVLREQYALRDDFRELLLLLQKHS